MKHIFRTSDLALATFLKLNSLELLSVSSVGRSKSTFMFRETDARQALVLDFFNHRGQVEPLEFVSVFKSLKGLAHEMKSDEIAENDHDTPERAG